MSSAPLLDTPLFSTPVRWTLRVLAWTAFGISAYLAWSAVNQTPVAGCGVGSPAGCDDVLGSTWSKWLGIPVAVPGLALYAALAGLSVVLGVQNSQASRWIHTAFIMLAVIAAIGSAWFILLQIFAIGHYCKYCLVTDVCGILIGGLAVGATIRWLNATRSARATHVSASNLMALRTTLPSVTGSSHLAPNRTHLAPSLPIALSGALFVIVVLIGGQILFREKSYELQQVALTETIDMSGSKQRPQQGEPIEVPLEEPAPLPADSRVAMRIPADPVGDRGQNQLDENRDSEVEAATFEDPVYSGSPATEESNPPSRSETAGEEQPTAAEEPAVEDLANVSEPAREQAEPVASPAQERIVEFLGGKLKLNVYEHPVIGSPEAPHVLVEMVSYNCKHCRSMHRRVKQALRRYGDQVAIIVMVVPLERKCNRLITSGAVSHPGACSTARMTLGVAQIKPEAFPKFHDWLMADEEEPPAIDRIVARAYSLVDREQLRDLSGGEELNERIAKYVDLYATLGNQNRGKKFGLPVQILGDHVMAGGVDNTSDLYEAWEQHLGLEPPSPSRN